MPTHNDSSFSDAGYDIDTAFNHLFYDLSVLKIAAVQGQLESTNLRFLAWMIFLECLPPDKSKWQEIISNHRNVYEEIKEKACCDPHKIKAEQSTECTDHPLSDEAHSEWNKHFFNNELKSMIYQDVIRM